MALAMVIPPGLMEARATILPLLAKSARKGSVRGNKRISGSRKIEAAQYQYQLLFRRFGLEAGAI